MPTFEIDGSPGGIRARASLLRSKADLLITTGDALGRITTEGWNSRAADRFREKYETEPERWRAGGDGFLTAASSLEAYAAAVESAQQRARWAEAEYARGEQVTVSARAAYDADVARARDEASAVAARGQLMTLTIVPFEDPGETIRQAALAEYAAAKADLEAAAHLCADGVRAGCAAAPEERKWYESVGAAIGGFLVGAGEALLDLGKLVAFLGNPAAFLFMELSMDAAGGMTAEEIAAKNRLRLEDAQGLLDALRDDPVEFGKNIGKALLDWDTWTDDPARALGHLVPDAILAVATGGAGAAVSRGVKGGADTLDALSDLNRLDDPTGLDDLGRVDGLAEGRVYRLGDDTPHETRFAPEQISSGTNARSLIDGALEDPDLFARHGVDQPWTRQDLIDRINTPTSELSPSDRAILTDLRDTVPAPEAGTPMQKVVTQGQVDDYLAGHSATNPYYEVDGIGGSVTRVEDTAHLSTPGDLYDGLRLDYPGTPFQPDDDTMRVLRFEPDDDNFVVPRNSDMGGAERFDEWSDPFTGNGFTKAGDDVVPEFQVDRGVTMRDGAEMWEIRADGAQELVAVLRKQQWVEVPR